jgi:hypothetical protein
MVSSDSQRSPTVLRAAVLQAQLNAIEPEVFSLQGFQALTQQQPEQQRDAAGGAAAAAADLQQQENVAAAGSGCRFTLAPLKIQGLSLDSATSAPDWQQVQVRDWRLLSDFCRICMHCCWASASFCVFDTIPWQCCLSGVCLQHTYGMNAARFEMQQPSSLYCGSL